MDPFSNLFSPKSFTNNSSVNFNFDNNKETFPPEPQSGNIEYKLKIINPTNKRFQHLVSQMNWRLREGNGEAIYAIGVSDNGLLLGISKNELMRSLENLEKMAETLGATATVLCEKHLEGDLHIAEVLIRKIPLDKSSCEIRIAVLGGADAGKSTLLGVLTQGALDNGRGRARLNMFRHLHEIQSGRTSSISHEILGFDSSGNPITYNNNNFRTTEYICESSTKLVSFLDLAGHKKYLKTTVQGLSGYVPHYSMLIISSTAGTVKMAQEHLSITKALGVPVFIVVTKTDLSPPEATLESLKQLLKQVGSHRVPFVVENMDDVITASTSQTSGSVVPIFCVSNLSGSGLNLLTKFLYVLPSRVTQSETERLRQEPPEFEVDEIFKSVDVEQLLGGLVTKGTLTEGMEMKIGPCADGSFVKTTIESIHRNRMPVKTVHACQSAVLKLVENIENLRTGMVLLSNHEEVSGSLYFQASVTVLYHATAIYPGFQTTVHIANMRQTASVVGILGCNCIRMNETASVLFKFKSHPEYVRVGQKILFRDGASKGTGEVTQVFPLLA